MRIVSAEEFTQAIIDRLVKEPKVKCDFVTGPGRSGAIASAMVSHLSGIPFVPYGQEVYTTGRFLIVDTARKTGATMRAAMRKYADFKPVEMVFYEEPPRVSFWYESKAMQRRKAKLEKRYG